MKVAEEFFISKDYTIIYTFCEISQPYESESLKFMKIGQLDAKI